MAAVPGGKLSTAQLATLLTELNTDPNVLGYPAYLSPNPFDAVSLAAVIDFVRDGVTACPVNSVVGQNGAITGATNATPIVVTSTGHGLVTGDQVVIAGVLGNTGANSVPLNPAGLPSANAVAPVPSWTVTKVDANTFSLNSSVGNGAYTSGGTWTRCVAALANANKIFNQSVPVASIKNNILPADAASATALTGTQSILLPPFLDPKGSIQLTDSVGNELASVLWLNLLAPAGSVSRKAVKALETRFGSRAEQVLNIQVANPGQLIFDIDIQAALVGHY